MIEQLLGFFLALLGLETQQSDIPYYGSGVELTGYLSTGDISYDMNYQEIQKQVIIEDYFLFLDRLGRINYARGCAGEATPPIWNGIKRVRCGIKSFDCGGLMKYYGRIKGIFTQDDMGYLRSDTLYGLGMPKDPRTAERGDFMYWRGFGKNSTGNNSTHFAVVSSGYNEITHSILIYDNIGEGRNKTGEREIKVVCNEKLCYYAGMFRIYIATNGLVELANERGINVNAFKTIDK